jgi:hypothetical protein
VHWVKAERASCAPDRRLQLSLFRTPSPRKKKIAIAVSALGTVAAAAGAIGVWSAGAAAGPAATARQPYSLSQAAHHVAVGHGAPLLASGHNGAELDAFTAVLARKPASGVIGKAASAKAAKKKHAKARPLTPEQIARRMLGSFRWRGWQFKYLNLLWSRESGWNVFAENPYSGAYGIPQAVPGSKMSSAGPNWESDARTQIRWGLRYIKAMYGSPLAAWQHELATGWY